MRWPHQWHQSKGSSEVNLTKVTDFGDEHSELHLPRYCRPGCLAHPGPVAKVQMLQRAMPVTWRCCVESLPDSNWPRESWGFFGRAFYRLLLKHWRKRHTCVVGDSTKKGSHQFIRKKKNSEHAGFLSRWKPLALDKSRTFSGTSPRADVEDWTSRELKPKKDRLCQEVSKRSCSWLSYFYWSFTRFLRHKSARLLSSQKEASMSCDLQGIQRGYSHQMHNAARNQRRLRRGMLFSMRIKPFNMRGLGYFKKSRLCLARCLTRKKSCVPMPHSQTGL